LTLALIVYLIGVLPQVSSWLGFFAFVLAVGLFGSALFLLLEGNSSRYDYRGDRQEAQEKQLSMVRWGKRCIFLMVVPVLMGFTCVMIPSEKTLYAMVAAYGVETLATNEKVQTVLGSGVDVLNLQLEQYRDSLLSEKTNTVAR
jgi:hypothetical protein